MSCIYEKEEQRKSIDCFHQIGSDTVNRINHTEWIAVVPQTYGPKSVRNREIEIFGGGFLFSLNFHFYGKGAFVIKMGQVSFLYSYKANSMENTCVICFISPYMHGLRRHCFLTQKQYRNLLYRA